MILRLSMAADEREEEVNLQQEIWCKLPDDPTERIILKLPLVSLLRARSVCRGWNLAIQSRRFMDTYAKNCKQDPWLLIFPYNDPSAGLAYDPSSKRWLEISFRFLPVESRVMAMSHGSICMLPKSSHHKQWLVCNPISKAWMSIPCPPGLFKLFFLAVGLFVEEDIDATIFKVIMAGSELVAEDSEQFNLATEVYDSRLGYWVKGENLLLDAPLSPWKATCKGVMYCITGHLPFRVMGYDVKRGVWFEVKAQMPENLTTVRLIDHNGVLLMVGGIGDNSITSRIGMWTLNGTNTKWSEYGWMPAGLCHDLLQTRTGRFVCIGQANILYFSSKRCHGVLEHNMLARSWQWISVNPFFVNIHYHMHRGFHFLPSL
ncbi:hypothetical protein GOP47_0022242 [Adiantum capillus-veneris]|uniref:F-box domain-containing protein n=1 Tax=Adiantum capillus-veneris TaxID=13818 RepID=A0A9D4U987_ADICA|nr:hypothetical protein GOP47_0022242 [Adiantum capillus-veneris]